MKTIRTISAIGLAVFLIMVVVLSAVHGVAITAVTVQIKPGVEEPDDKKLPGGDDADRLPDYKLLIEKADGALIRLGTKLNTSAREPLTWTVSDPISLRYCQTIVLIEEDKLLDDQLAKTNVPGTTFETDKYTFRLETTRTFKAAQEYLADTPVGIAILVGIGLAIFLYVLSLLSWG